MRPRAWPRRIARGASRLIAAMAPMLVIVACSDVASPAAKSGAPTAVAPLIPLSIGTRWIYNRVDSIEFTTDSLLESFHSTVTFGVISDTTDALGAKWAVLDSSNYILGGAILGHNYLANFSDGVYDLGAVQGVSFALKTLQFAYPTTTGAVFDFGIGRVLSTDSTMTVQAGTFHCIVYAVEQERIFVAPGVGVVMRSLTPTEALDSSGALLLKEQVFYTLRSMTAQ